jgi:hypothetical protein
MVLTFEEEKVTARLQKQMRTIQKTNTVQESYYEGSKRVDDLGISIPPQFKAMAAVVGWPEIVVDVIDERMQWQGWLSDNPDVKEFLRQSFDANSLAVELGQAVLDSLIYGMSFVSVGTGEPQLGEPEVLIKAESPSRMTGTWDSRKRRLVEAYAPIFDTAEKPKEIGYNLYLPDATVTVIKDGRSTSVTRDEHGMGRVPIACLVNRPRASRPGGRSEITQAVRSITESGMRTLLGAEFTREFYGAPRRALMGGTEEMFEDKNGDPVSKWQAVLEAIWVAPRDDNGELPVLQSFEGASPQPFIELIKMYAQLMSATTGVPITHLGFGADNPASADAIREANSRLDNRAVKRQQQFDLGLTELAEIALLWGGQSLPERGSITSLWANPSTISPAAAADFTQKMIAAGAIPPRSDVTWEGLGYRASDIQRIRADWAEVDNSRAAPIRDLTSVLSQQGAPLDQASDDTV